MFKNNVFKVSVDTAEWTRAALVRAVRTAAQTFVAMVGTAATMGSVDWKLVLSSSLLAGILSVVTSVAGLPEVKEE